MKIAMLQLNYLIGDIEGNARKILAGYNEAWRRGAELVVCSELCLFGYPPQDMLEKQNYLDEQDAWLTEIMSNVGQAGLVMGVARKNYGDGKPLFNAAVLLHQKRVVQTWRKALLPTYDVFNEYRYFEPGRDKAFTFPFKGHKVAMLLCEDIWNDAENEEHKMYGRNPVRELRDDGGCDILVVPNGSPYYWGKGTVRSELVHHFAKKLDCLVVYVNQVGGNDDLVFDGRSFAVNRFGRCVAAANSFAEDIVLVDILNPPSKVVYPHDAEKVSELYTALVLGIRDYVHKNGFKGVVLGLSGGIDSALTATIAVDALGKENVLGVSMPSRFSSEGSMTDAKQLSENLGIKLETVLINKGYNVYGQMLGPIIGWEEPGAREGDVTEENIQARIRGNILMAISNRTGRLLLTTGNKSENAVGYCTLYGDMAGGFAPLIDVPKTMVYELARWRNRQSMVIPENTITKPPSAELRAGQKDTDSLPPYDVLDEILRLHLECGMSGQEILNWDRKDFKEEETRKVLRLLNKAEYKRRQYPPGPKVTTKAFGSGRRWPIACKSLE